MCSAGPVPAGMCVVSLMQLESTQLQNYRHRWRNPGWRANRHPLWTGYRSSTQQLVSGTRPTTIPSQLSQFRILRGLHHGSIRDFGKIAKAAVSNSNHPHHRPSPANQPRHESDSGMLFLFRSEDHVSRAGTAGKRAVGELSNCKR